MTTEHAKQVELRSKALKKAKAKEEAAWTYDHKYEAGAYGVCRRCGREHAVKQSP
jgi:RNA polymerase-binding transcription factor DksA